MEILSLDPSVNNVGVAWHDTESQRDNWDWILVKPSGGTLFARLQNIKLQIDKWLTRHGRTPLHLVAEYPQFFMGAKGAVAATQGYTLDLACICGHMSAFFPLHTQFYMPSVWKGNWSKKAIEFRFKQFFGEHTLLPSEHEQEAAMMLKYYVYESNDFQLP